MWQGAVKRLCNRSKSCHVRKVARLLAQALNYRGIEWGLGWAFIRDANGQNAFSNLSRYETAIERGLYKALHELQRLQADRAPGGSIQPPLAVDVDAPEIPSGISERLALFGNNRI